MKTNMLLNFLLCGTIFFSTLSACCPSTELCDDLLSTTYDEMLERQSLTDTKIKTIPTIIEQLQTNPALNKDSIIQQTNYLNDLFLTHSRMCPHAKKVRIDLLNQIRIQIKELELEAQTKGLNPLAQASINNRIVDLKVHLLE